MSTNEHPKRPGNQAALSAFHERMKELATTGNPRQAIENAKETLGQVNTIEDIRWEK